MYQLTHVALALRWDRGRRVIAFVMSVIYMRYSWKRERANLAKATADLQVLVVDGARHLPLPRTSATTPTARGYIDRVAVG